MKIELPPEILDKQFPVFPLLLRIMMCVFPIATFSGFIASFFDTPTDFHLSAVLFIVCLITCYLTILLWKYSISFTAEGFSRGAFRKKETRWEEITEVLRTTEYNGLSILYLKKQDGKQFDISLPVKWGKHLIEQLERELERDIYGVHLNFEEFKVAVWPRWTRVITQIFGFGILAGASYLKSVGINLSPVISNFIDEHFILTMIILMTTMTLVMPIILLPMMAILSGALEATSSRLKFSPVLGTKAISLVWDEVESISEVINDTFLGLACRSIIIKTKGTSTRLRMLNPEGFLKLSELVDSYNSQKQS